MASTVSATYAMQLTVVETFTGNYISTSDNTTTHNGLNASDILNAGSAVPATKVASFDVTMSGGTGSINLAALPGLTADETVVGTGLKVQAVIFKNKATNANEITVAKGASSGFGISTAGTTWSMPISPGQAFMILGNDATPDVASGARVIDVTGTLAQVLQVIVLLG